MEIKKLGTRPAPVSPRELLAQVARGHAPLIGVPRRQLPYWQERGWTRNGNTYRGTYQTRFAKFQGRIEERAGGHFDFLLFNPSAEIREHRHWECFMPRGNDWYLIHMGHRPRDLSSGILAVERLITDAYQE